MEQKIFDSLLEPLKEVDIELCSVEFGEEDGEKTLFVKIDSKSGVDTNLCVKATEIINPIIDKLDLIREEYVLDVCSKGEE